MRIMLFQGTSGQTLALGPRGEDIGGWRGGGTRGTHSVSSCIHNKPITAAKRTLRTAKRTDENTSNNILKIF